MADATAATLRGRSESSLDAGAILNALSKPVFAIDGTGHFTYLNHASEQFFEASAQSLVGRPLSDSLPEDSPVFALIEQVRLGGHSVTEFGVTIETPRIGSHLVAVNAAPVAEHPGDVVLSLQERSIASKIERQLTHRGAARSVTAMAAMLAHELKNPLSGIRGAAQLLEPGVSDGDREFTQLICDEVDRIVALVDRMELFSDDRPIERAPVNIHEVLEHVRKLAASGFARNLNFMESYDPSLPAVYGNRDMLVQVLLNLVKNGAEAMAADGGEIHLSTRYRHGVRLAVPGTKERVALPIQVSVRDNGPGIPEDIRAHLFDAFVTTKAGGKGLGLALVAKIVGDHGGVIEFDSGPRRTEFRVMLPVVSAGTGTE